MSLGVHGALGVYGFIDVYGYPRVSMDIYGFLWVFRCIIVSILFIGIYRYL